MFRQGGAWGNGLVFALAAVALLDARAARDAAGVGEVQPGAAGEVERTDMFKQLPVEDVASMEGARWAGKRAQQVADGSLGEAYVTLCYRESYVLGVRVLGKSLRETGTTKDMVVLVTGISDLSVETLEMDGWIVKRVKMVANPGLVGSEDPPFPFSQLSSHPLYTFPPIPPPPAPLAAFPPSRSCRPLHYYRVQAARAAEGSPPASGLSTPS